MADTNNRKGSGLLYNPYMDRKSRASSVGSIRDKSMVEKEEYSDDSEELGKPAPKVEVKKQPIQTKSPLIISDEKQKRGGFFSNMKQLLEMRKVGQSLSRGVIPTRSGDVSVRSVNVSIDRGTKTNSNTETSITAGKISMAQFMDNLATQKKINTSMLAARKLASQSKDHPESMLKITPNVPKGMSTLNKDKTFSGGFQMNLKINKNEFSNLATDMSSKLK